MAYARPFIRFTVSGSATSEDIWSNGLSISGGLTSQTLTIFNSLDIEAMANAASTFYRGTDQDGMNTYNTIDTVKLALIGTDGKYIADPRIYDFSSALPGTGRYNTSPQDSLVLSLTTNFKRGLARRGRIYLPSGFAQPAYQDGRIPLADVQRVLTNSETYIDALNAEIQSVDANSWISVVSNQRAGAANTVTGLEVGNLMDNQNRRRNRITEVYEDVSLFS